MDFLNMGFIQELFVSTIRMATPLLLVALGELFSEKAGMVNIGLDGIMTFGALSGFLVSYITGSPYLGILAGALGGLIINLIYAFCTVTLCAEQIVYGMALNIFAPAVATFIYRMYFGITPTLATASLMKAVPIPLLSEIPIIGKAFFNHTPIVYMAYILAVSYTHLDVYKRQLEDFDHLYRYSDLLEMEYNVLPEKLVGGYTEIMPGRPTISEHRYPYDSIRKYIKNKNSNMLTILNVNIITAAEQQTMNYYMNVGAFYSKSDLGRRLYQEIAMIEEQHVSQYESLKDTTVTWLEDLLMHEYTECYLYYSCMKTEPNPYIRKLWEQFMVQEISHLHKAKDLLWKYEGKQWQQVIPCGTFPEILCLGSNIEYVRDVLANTVQNTAKRECIVPVCDLPKDYEFFKYQDIVNHDAVSYTHLLQLLNLTRDEQELQRRNQPLSPSIRQSLTIEKKLLSEYAFLKSNDLHSTEDILNFMDSLTAEIASLEAERQKIRNSNRRPKSDEERQAKNTAARELSKKLKPLRKELKLAESALERYPQVWELLKTERDAEIKSRNRNREKER